ncbi:uncharacterized protein LOC144166275 [Haemaphysalis longicornis]
MNPFENPDAWGVVLKNVTRAVQRELTIRGVKERVDLLVGYFRQEDRANLRRSGTEEQYGEREQLLQEISDLTKSAGYVPRTLPRTANGTGLRRPPLSSAAARQRAARQFRDGVTAAIAPLQAPNDEHMLDEPSPSQLLLSMYDSEVTQSSAAEVHERARLSPTGHGSFTSRPVQDVPATASRIRALQAMGLQLLTAREENEFILRQKEVELQKRRLEHDEKRLAFDEIKLALEEARLKLHEQQVKENAQMMSTIKSMLEEQGKQISSLHK